MLLIPDDSNRD